MLDLKIIDIDYDVENIITSQIDDTWDLISFIIYGDEQYAADFIYANKYLNLDYYIDPNIDINIPLIDTNVKDFLPPWKK